MKLRDARRQRYLSIRDLAKLAGVAPRTIHETESGHTVPYFVSIRKIAAALDVEPGDIDEFAARSESVNDESVDER